MQSDQANLKDCDNTPSSKANWKKNKLKSGQVPKFIGSATSDSVLHRKVVTNGSNQAGQLLALVNALFSYIAEQQLPNWAESLRHKSVRATTATLVLTESSYGTRLLLIPKKTILTIQLYGKRVKCLE